MMKDIKMNYIEENVKRYLQNRRDFHHNLSHINDIVHIFKIEFYS